MNVNNKSTNLSNTSTASEKKIQNIQVTSIPANKKQITGYRLVHMEILPFIFSALEYPGVNVVNVNLIWEKHF